MGCGAADVVMVMASGVGTMGAREVDWKSSDFVEYATTLHQCQILSVDAYYCISCKTSS